MSLFEVFRVCTLLPDRPNSRQTSNRNDDRQPIFRSCGSGPKKTKTYQCALKMKAEAAIHADMRRTVRDPNQATHTEPSINSSVVAALTAAITACY